MRSIGIVGTGAYLPEKVLTNDDLARMVETSDQWIYSKVGVKERRIAAPDEATSDLAVRAAEQALSRAGIAAVDLDLIVLATSTPDMIQPSTAAIVQGKLGAVRSAAFDVSAVCSGSVYALDVAVGMMQWHHEYKKALVIGAETYSRVLDWSDRTTCVFFGDGAGAAVLGDAEQGAGAVGSVLGTDGKNWDVITVLGGGSRFPATHETVTDGLHRFQMQGKEVWDFATTVVPTAISDLLDAHCLVPQDLSLLVFHQANINIIKRNMQAMGLPMSRTHTCIEKYANTSGASVLIALNDAVEIGKVARGDLVLLVGFGGGLSWAASIWRWE